MGTRGLNSLKHKGCALTEELHKDVAAATAGKVRFVFLCVSGDEEGRAATNETLRWADVAQK